MDSTSTQGQHTPQKCWPCAQGECIEERLWMTTDALSARDRFYFHFYFLTWSPTTGPHHFEVVDILEQLGHETAQWNTMISGGTQHFLVRDTFLLHFAQIVLNTVALAYLVLEDDHGGKQILSSFCSYRPCNGKRLNLEIGPLWRENIKSQLQCFIELLISQEGVTTSSVKGWVLSKCHAN